VLSKTKKRKEAVRNTNAPTDIQIAGVKVFATNNVFN